MASRSFDDEKPTSEPTEDEPSKKKNKLLVDNKTKKSLKRKHSLEYQEMRNEKKIKFYREIMRMIERTYAVVYRTYEDHVNNNVPDATS